MKFTVSWLRKHLDTEATLEEITDKLTAIGLEVEETFFAVTLSFNKVQEHLVIPFAALTQFADPSVRFGLQLQSTGTPPAGRLEKVTSGEDAMAAEVISDTEAKVVNIDSFRKK